MTKQRRYSPEFRARAVIFVRDVETRYPSQRAAIAYIAEKLDCPSRSLRDWVRKAEVEAKRARLTADERRRLRTLERENRELRMSGDRLRKAATSFARAALNHTPLWPVLRPRRVSTAVLTPGNLQPDPAELLTAALMTLYASTTTAEPPAAVMESIWGHSPSRGHADDEGVPGDSTSGEPASGEPRP